MPVVFGLDVTDVSRWEETVLNPALQILDSLSKVGPQQSELLLSLLSFVPVTFIILAFSLLFSITFVLLAFFHFLSLYSPLHCKKARYI